MNLRLSHFVCLGALSCISLAVYASGYELPLGDAAQIGTNMGGEAALAEDASTGFYNPAGLALIKHKQFVASVAGVRSSLDFTGQTSTISAVNPAFNYTSPAGSSANVIAQGVVPALHFAMPINERMTGAFGILSPFGLVEHAPTDSVLRYVIDSASLTFTDFTPSIGYAVNDQLALGIGADAVFGVQQSKNEVRFTPNNDGRITTSAHGWGFGWHGGALYRLSDATRFGFSYHSKVDVKMHGYSTLYQPDLTSVGGPGAASYQSHNLRAGSTTPSFATLGFFHQVDTRWDLMGTLKYMLWSDYDTQHVYHIYKGPSPVTGAPVYSDSNTPQRNRNTLELSMGARFHYTSQLQFSFGGALAQTPTTNAGRLPRVMDGNRMLLSVGTRYQVTPHSTIDLAYAHGFYRQTWMNHTEDDGNSTNTNGKIRPSTNVIGLQFTQDFA